MRVIALFSVAWVVAALLIVGPIAALLAHVAAVINTTLP